MDKDFFASLYETGSNCDTPCDDCYNFVCYDCYAPTPCECYDCASGGCY